MLKLFVSASNFVTAPLRRDDQGATAVEYGLIVALIAAVIIGTVAALGTKVNAAFQTIVNGM